MRYSMKLPGLSLYPGTGKHWWESITSDEMVQVAQRADQLGFDYLTVSEHFAMNPEWAKHMGTRWVHSLSAAGVILGATKRIKVVCLLVVPYHQPIELAKALSTLSFMSDGRIVALALVGYNDWEFGLLQVPMTERGSRTDEYLDAARELWTSDNPTYHGRHVDFEDLVFDPKPVAPLPLWFGGRTRATMRRVARIGDGWIPYATPRSEFREMVDYLKEQPGFVDRPRELELSLPMFEGKRDPYSHEVIEQAPVSLEPDDIMQQISEIAALGATMTAADDVLGTGKFQNDLPGAPPKTANMQEHLERMEWFAETIFPATRE